MTGSLDLPLKETYQLLKFSFGHDFSTIRAYTNWARTVSGTPDFEPTPNLEVTLPENNGTLEESNLIVQMPLDDFTTRLSSGIAHSPCRVEIWEFTQPEESGPATNLLKVWDGLVTRTVRHPNGQRNRIEIRSQLQKSRLDVPLGIPATYQCGRALGIGLCFAAVVERPGLVVVSIQSRAVEVDSLDTTALEDRHFHRGYLERDGLLLPIREWRIDEPEMFYLSRQAPADWDGQTIKAISGCDKTVETCKRRYDREEDFFGIGFAIPAYNPQTDAT